MKTIESLVNMWKTAIENELDGLVNGGYSYEKQGSCKLYHDSGHEIRSGFDVARLFAQEQGIVLEDTESYKAIESLARECYDHLVQKMHKDADQGAFCMSPFLGEIVSKGHIGSNIRYNLEKIESFADAFGFEKPDRKAIAETYLQSTFNTLRTTETAYFKDWEPRHRVHFLREMYEIAYVGRLDREKADGYIMKLDAELKRCMKGE